MPQRIKHKDQYAAAEHERLEECATKSAANHNHIGCHKKAPLYTAVSVSVINNDRILWPPATGAYAIDHGFYIIKVINGDEYRWGWDHIHECHPNAVKPDMHTKVEVAGQPITTPSTSSWSAGTCCSHSTTICYNTQVSCNPNPNRLDDADVQPLTSRTDVTFCWSGHVSKVPQCIIEQM